MTTDNADLKNTEKHSKYSAERLAGLKPYQPGQSGNPAGRPPNTKYVSDYLREALQELTDGKTNAELIAESLILLSKDPKMRGFVVAIKELLDRTEGKVPDTHKIESDVPITLIFKLEEEDAVQGQNEGQGSSQGTNEEKA